MMSHTTKVCLCHISKNKQIKQQLRIFLCIKLILNCMIRLVSKLRWMSEILVILSVYCLWLGTTRMIKSINCELHEKLGFKHGQSYLWIKYPLFTKKSVRKRKLWKKNHETFIKIFICLYCMTNIQSKYWMLFGKVYLYKLKVIQQSILNNNR